MHVRVGIAAILVALTVTLTLGCARLNRPDPANAGLQQRNRPATSTSSHRGLRVVTYNVHMRSAVELARSVRGSRVLFGADIIMLQEIEHQDGESRSRAALLAAQLGMSYAYAPGYGLGATGSHGVAILSRYPLRDIEMIELPRFHVVFNSARRVAIGATVTAAGRDTRVYVVHLDNRISPADRIKQIAPVIRRAVQHTMPVIVAGDVNTTPFSWVGHVLPVPTGRQGKQLERYVRSMGFDTPVTRSGPTSKWLSMRLDAIYTRGFHAQRFGVARTVRLSDHLPLWADLL